MGEVTKPRPVLRVEFWPPNNTLPVIEDWMEPHMKRFLARWRARIVRDRCPLCNEYLGPEGSHDKAWRALAYAMREVGWDVDYRSKFPEDVGFIGSLYDRKEL